MVFFTKNKVLVWLFKLFNETSFDIHFFIFSDKIHAKIEAWAYFIDIMHHEGICKHLGSMKLDKQMLVNIIGK